MAVSLRINGIDVNADPRDSILDAARAHGIFIPTLCDHPKLPPFGACRMCVVQVGSIPGFPTACTIRVAEGMEVQTETPAVQALRREILSLMLSEHPYTCLTCDVRSRCDAFSGTVRKAAVTTGCQYCPQNGLCEIQKLTEYLGIREVPYPISYRGLRLEREDPFFDRDYNLCIHCGRCVRVCHDVRHAGVLAFIRRGSDAIVGTAFRRSHVDSNCQFCGACVDVCPSGALFDKRSRWEGVPTRAVPSVCPYCSVGCAIDLLTRDDRVVRTQARDGGATNDGQLCVRGRFGVVEIVHGLSRFLSPMVRRDGRLVETSWEQAIQRAAEGLAGARGAAFAAVGSAAASNEESYLLQKLARAVMGSNNVTLAAGLPRTPTMDLERTLRNVDGLEIRAVRDAASILVIGTNAFESHPILGLEIRHAAAKGARVIAVDPRRTALARASSTWLQPALGTDHMLLAGVMKVVGDARRAAKEPVDFDLGWVDVLDIGKVAEATCVPAETIQAVGRDLAANAPRVIMYGSGVTHHPTAPEVLKAIQNLALLLGDTEVLGAPGGANVVGAHDVGAHPALLPGYRPVADPEARAAFETLWGVALSAEAGLTYHEVMDGIASGRIRALYLAGETPAMDTLQSLDFVVLQDFIPSENTRYAHVVLPVRTFAETDGTFTNLEGRIQRFSQAIPPVGLARPGWMILRDVANRLLGRVAWAYESAADVMREIAGAIAAYRCVDYERIGPQGVRRRFEGCGEARRGLVPFQFDALARYASAEYPLVLVTERNLFAYRGASLTEQVKGMSRIKAEDVLHLSAADARRLNVAEGSLVKTTSPYGSAESIVSVGNGMPEGLAFTSINISSGSPLLPGGVPNLKALPIRVERATFQRA